MIERGQKTMPDRRSRGRARRAALAVAALALGATLVPSAAGANTIAGGQSALRLDAVLVKQLDEAGVQVFRVKPGALKGRTATLPIAEGQVDFAARGSMRHKGGIGFRTGKRVVLLKRVFLNTAKEVLSATIGKRSLMVASTEPHSVKWDGFDLAAAVRELSLTGKAARLLNTRLGLDHVFRGGQSLGRIESAIQLEWLTVFGGEVTTSFDAGFDTKLKSLEVAATPFESTRAVSPLPPAFAMDVPHGQITPELNLGVLVTEGGFRLTQGTGPEAQVVAATGLSVTLDSRKLSGSFRSQSGNLPGASQLASLDFGSATVDADPRTGTISMTGAKATLEAAAADLLNEAFAKPKGKAPLFGAGEVLGTVGFTARTR